MHRNNILKAAGPLAAMLLLLGLAAGCGGNNTAGTTPGTNVQSSTEGKIPVVMYKTPG